MRGVDGQGRVHDRYDHVEAAQPLVSKCPVHWTFLASMIFRVLGAWPSEAGTPQPEISMTAQDRFPTIVRLQVGPVVRNFICYGKTASIKLTAMRARLLKDAFAGL
jgi:hypothetical protein